MPLSRLHETYWVVYVLDPGVDATLEGEKHRVNTARHERRFDFRGSDSQDRSLACYRAAKAAGFEARIDRVRAYREEPARV